MDNYFWEMLSLVRNKNIKIIINYVLGPLVFILLCVSIYNQIQHQPNWKESIQQLKKGFTGPYAWMLLLAFLLVFLNWGFEARKWQLAMTKLQTISFWQSYKAIFTGTTMASFTPNRTGEYVGRILYVEQGKRVKAIPVTIMCSMAQLQVTIYTGIVALLTLQGVLAKVFDWDRAMIIFSQAFAGLAIAGAILLTLIYFRIGGFLRRIHRWRPIHKIIPYVEVVEQFNATILLRILSLSVCRYLVFVVQYYLVFRVFEVQVSWSECLMSISILFLLLAIIPSFTFLTDLGIRWKAGIEIVSIFSSNTVGIFATAFTIWVFNLIIPALIGSLLILGIRIYKNKEA
jgi:lysylphosphatidylglycerol synthase-like protein